MQHVKKVVSWALSLCLVLSLLVGVPLPARAADKDVINVTCVGDSITAGYKASSSSKAYPQQMEKILGDGYKVTNAGSSGATVIRSLDEGYNKRDVYKKGLESEPDIVIIMIGTNDAILGNVKNEEGQKNFRKDYIALIEDYEKCGTNPKIILGLPTTSVAEQKNNFVEDERDVNNEKYLIPIIKEIAKEKNLQLLDAHSYTGAWSRPSADKNQYLADGLHPNDAGYEKLARYYANAVLGYTEKFTGDIQEDTNYSIVAKSSGKAMSIKDNSTDGGAGICQMKDEDYESQAWKIVPATDESVELGNKDKKKDNKKGYYVIMNQYTGKVLNIPNNSTKEGTQIIQWGNNVGDNELFQIEATGDGYWTISPKLNPSLRLTISNNSKDDGAAVIQKKSSDEDNQKWKLESIPKIKRLSDGKITITCVGDSITEGVGSSAGMNYPSQMRKLLGDEYWVYNVGVAGTTVQRSIDLAYSKTSNYKIGLASEPDVVIIFLGTNDAERTPTDAKLEEFRKDYAALIEEYQNCGSEPKIMLATFVTTVSDKDNKINAQDDKNEQALIPIVRELAEEYDLQVLDVHNYTGSWTAQKLGEANAYLYDGLHPNDEGYKRLAKLYANAVLGYIEGFTGDLQENTQYRITSKSSGMAISVEENSQDSNAGICQTKSGDSKSQIWEFETIGHGYYQIINQASGKVLAVPNSSTEKGMQLIQADKGNEDNKQWKIEATGDGHWIIMPKLAQEQALSVSGNSKEDGGKIVQDSCSEAENQQWKLEDIAQGGSNQPKLEYTMMSMEGETGTIESEAVIKAAEDSSNGYYVGAIGGDAKGSVSFTVDAEAAGRRTMNIYYASDDSNVRKMDVIVNDASKQLGFEKNGSWEKPGEEPKSVKISLKEGKNTIKLTGVDGGYGPNVDRIELQLTDKERKSVVTSMIDSLPETVTDSVEEQALLKGVKLAYDQLDDDLKKEITNVAKLEAALGEEKPPVVDDKEEDQKAADAVIKSITEIGTVTLDSEEVIKEAREAYDALTEAQKELVTNYEDLEAAEESYTTLKEEYDQATDEQKADLEAAQGVISQIAAIGTVTLESEDTIKKAKAAYIALTDEQKQLVTNYKDLESAEETYAQLKEEYDQASDEQKANIQAAAAVTGKITAIGTVSLESQSAIKEAREAYDALTEAQKKLVANLKDLEAAEENYAKLEAEAEQKEDKDKEQKEKEDKEAAEAVEDEISAIGTVTLQSESQIQEVRAAYDALTKDQKKLVTNYTDLEAAEAAYAQLKQDEANKQTIILPNITLPGNTDNVQQPAPSVKVEGITITGESNKIAVGKSITLTANVEPATATDRTVTWKSSDTRYATVDADGCVTVKKAAKNKTVTITAIANDGSGKQATFKIKGMSKAVKKIRITAKSNTVVAGKKITLKALITPNLSTKKINKTLTWISEDEDYATVNKKGVVRTKKAGKGETVKITALATDGSNKKATFKIYIK